MISDEAKWDQLRHLFIGEKAKKKRLSWALVAEAVSANRQAKSIFLRP